MICMHNFIQKKYKMKYARKRGYIMKTLIVFYSYSNHTRETAEYMKNIIKCDIAEIIPVKQYTAIYQKLVDSTENNREEKKTPEIRKLETDINDYDRIIIGTPVWWYTMAEPIRTFLNENNLKGKQIMLFATNAGWPGSTFKDMISIIGNDANTLDVKYSVDGAERLTPKYEIERFLKQL